MMDRELYRKLERELMRLLAYEEELARALLSMWVSGTEPQFFRCAENGNLFGIGHVGADAPTFTVEDLEQRIRGAKPGATPDRASDLQANTNLHQSHFRGNRGFQPSDMSDKH